MEALQDCPNVMWKVSKALRTEKKSYPAIHGARGLAYDMLSKTEAIADSYELQFQLDYNADTDLDHVDNIETIAEKVKNLEIDQTTIELTDPTEVK